MAHVEARIFTYAYMSPGHENERKFVNKPDALVCNDTDLCTYDDKCMDGTCVGVRYRCDLEEEQKLGKLLCATKYTCTGERLESDDGEVRGGCTFTAAKKDTSCRPQRDACAANNLVCDGNSGECPKDTYRDPELHVNSATVIMSAPADPKKLYTHPTGDKNYVLHTTKDVSVRVVGVHSKKMELLQPTVCERYTLLWYLGQTNDDSIIDNNVAHGESESMDFTVTSETADLIEGADYFVCIKARNVVRKNIMSSLVCTEAIRIDRSPPRTGTIGFYADTSCKQALTFLTSSPDTVYACWANFTDEHSFVETFEVTVNEITSDGSTLVGTETVAGTESQVDISGLTLHEGSQYQLSIVAVNPVNEKASSQSQLVTVDRSPPQNGDVQFQLDGLVRLCFRMTCDVLYMLYAGTRSCTHFDRFVYSKHVKQLRC